MRVYTFPRPGRTAPAPGAVTPPCVLVCDRRRGAIVLLPGRLPYPCARLHLRSQALARALGCNVADLPRVEVGRDIFDDHDVDLQRRRAERAMRAVA